MEPDAGCSAAHWTCVTHMPTLCTSHWYPPSIINKYVAGITHKQTHTWDRPQFPLQSDIKQPAEGFPIAAVWSALNGCHWGTRFSHLPPSARSHLSLSLIIHLIWRPSVWLIGTFPEFHLFLAVGMSASLLLVKKLALNAHFPPFSLFSIVFYMTWHRQWLVNSATHTDLVQIQSITQQLTRDNAQNVLRDFDCFVFILRAWIIKLLITVSSFDQCEFTTKH